jgi:serine O-acetyltransferase
MHTGGREYKVMTQGDVRLDERGYVAEALLDRLRDDGVQFRSLGPEVPSTEAALAVAQADLAGMARRIARFAQDFDLRLVQLSRDERQRVEFILAWSDEVGRPSFLSVHALGDYYRAGRSLLRSEELLSGRPDVSFLYGLVEAIQAQAIDEARAAWLSRLWHMDPRGALERISGLWATRRDVRLLGQAAKDDSWDKVRAALSRLRRTLYRGLPSPLALVAKLNLVMRPRHAAIAFVGFDSPGLRERVVRDLAPAFPDGLDAFDHGYSERLRGIDVAVLFDPPGSYRARCAETIVVERAEALPPAAAKVERALLRWLERRVERRFSDTVVGANPLAARILQFACRHRVPLLADFMSTLLNCGIYCRLPAPILMPHPYGIFIHRNALIGSRVTVMQQVTIGNKHPSDPAAPVIEDNVCIGAGAKILGGLRVGHGATVGANAVVTRDVPSHCTVVGVNRILGSGTVVQERQPSVVNT